MTIKEKVRVALDSGLAISVGIANCGVTGIVTRVTRNGFWIEDSKGSECGIDYDNVADIRGVPAKPEADEPRKDTPEEIREQLAHAMKHNYPVTVRCRDTNRGGRHSSVWVKWIGKRADGDHAGVCITDKLGRGTVMDLLAIGSVTHVHVPEDESCEDEPESEPALGKIEQARQVMREAFKDDRDFKMTYIMNIEMLLYDMYKGEGHRERVQSSVAEKILDLIFG